MSKKAYIFDLNGTMINDMEYHIKAWHSILTSLGSNLSMERMKEECYGKNSELLDRIFPGRFTVQEKNAMSLAKETAYQEAFRPQLKLIDGLYDFISAANRQGIKMAIGSAAIMFNIDFVLDGTGIRKFIDAVVSADDVHESKPYPETFLKAADLLGVDPKDCLVFEDTPKGVEAANNAGMETVVLTTLHKEDEFESYHNIIRFAADYFPLMDLLPVKELETI
jgi:beta-phosphoglucomutase family hydrolase